MAIALGADYETRLDELDRLLDRAERLADDCERRSAAILEPSAEVDSPRQRPGRSYVAGLGD
jgi:hypothetical protein